MQKFVLGHETAINEEGVKCCVLQDGRLLLAFAEVITFPPVSTATQSAADGHEMPFRALSPSMARLVQDKLLSVAEVETHARPW